MALPKRKPDTKTLLAEAHASLAAIDQKQAELDANRLETEPASAIKTQIELDAARKDAEARIKQLEQRAADELRQRQLKAQFGLIERVEKKFAERDAAGAKVAEYLAAAVAEFRKATAANAAIAAAWSWAPTEIQACLLGRSFVSQIASELYRLSGQPYMTAEAARDFEFPGARCPSVTDPRPDSVRPLVEQLREATSYASAKIRAAPVRVLPVVAPAEPKPIAVAPTMRQAEPEKVAPAPSPANAVFRFEVDFVDPHSGKTHTEQVTLGPDEIAEASLDGLGGTGPRGREIALRVATARVSDGFVFAGRPNSLRFDLARLTESLNR